MKLRTDLIGLIFWSVIGVTPLTLLYLSKEIPGFFSLPLHMAYRSDD